jgi:hypothetical protein
MTARRLDNTPKKNLLYYVGITGRWETSVRVDPPETKGIVSLLVRLDEDVSKAFEEYRCDEVGRKLSRNRVVTAALKELLTHKVIIEPEKIPSVDTKKIGVLFTYRMPKELDLEIKALMESFDSRVARNSLINYALDRYLKRVTFKAEENGTAQ